MSGSFTLSVEERGAATIVVADTNVPLGESTCVSCGSCVQVCPTGALIDRQSAYLGNERHLTVTRTVCRACRVGCGILVHTRDNHIVKITGDWDAPNAGTLCKSGRFLPLDEKRTRLTTPFKRVAGQLNRHHLGRCPHGTRREILRFEGRHLAAITSTRLSVEALSAFKSLFADGLKSRMVTSIEEGRPSALQAKYADEVGAPIEGKLDYTTNCGLCTAHRRGSLRNARSRGLLYQAQPAQRDAPHRHRSARKRHGRSGEYQPASPKSAPTPPFSTHWNPPW
ncbi:MAG: 4Fe-4S binding protein [Ignavibacteriales bacterium]|nr:4Fe-4S binding protein [Ignavibacteriales bacterium]